MSRINLNSAISANFVNSFTGAASGSSSNALAQALSGNSSATSLSSGLRVGAQTFGRAVQGINSVVSFLGISKGTLEELGTLTDKMISLSERSSQASIGSDSRANYDREFQKLGKEFVDILEKSEVGDKKLLSRDDLSDLFKIIGLDQDSSDSIAAVFEEFVVFDKDSDATLGSEYAKGSRPVSRSGDAYMSRVTVGDGTFQAGISTPAPAGTSGVHFADANEDGKLDLFTTGFNGGGTGILNVSLSNGDGTFNAAYSTDTSGGSGGSRRVVTADVNNDNHLDAIVNEMWGTSVSVLFGRGDGTFETGAFYGLGSDRSDIQTGDFDGDGDIDLVSSDYGGSSVTVLLNAGDGTFGGAVNYDTLGSRVAGVKAGDFNGDGKVDLAAAGYDSNTLSILIGNGNGTFKVATSFAATSQPNDVAIADFDNDGDADVITSNKGGGTFNLLLGNGDGTFAVQADITAGDSVEAMSVGDFNGDGNMDLAATLYSSQTLQLFMGNGTGTFSVGASYSAGAGLFSQVAIGDVTGDNVADIAVAQYASSSASTFVGNSTISTRQTAARSSREFDTLFAEGRNIRSRPDALTMVHDLKALRSQIDTNLDSLDNALDVVSKNLELVRATGFALLDLSNTISDDAEAADVARMIQQQVRKNAPGTLAQAENLQPIAVAALSFTASSFGT